jgi:hypothetical protein
VLCHDAEGEPQMTAPYLFVGLYDPQRDGETLREAARVYLMLAGADVAMPDWEVGPGTPLAPEGRPAWLEVLQAEPAGMAQVVVSLGGFEDATPEQRRELDAAVLDLVAGVRPAFATVAVEMTAEGLPELSWPESWPVFATGWADPTRLSAAQRLRFEDLAEAGVVAPYADGLAWGLDRVVRPDAEGPDVVPAALAAAVYEAWTGRVAPDPAERADHLPAPDVDPAAPIPQVWWWEQGGDPEALRDRLAAALPDVANPAVLPGEPGWQPVVCELMPGAAARGLDVLRRSVGAVTPSWAAVQPAGGLAVPGFDPDLPVTGVLVNPWVSKAWADDALPELEAALAGAYREEVADGVLWVTDQRLAEVPDESWGDDDVRWRRLVAVADILGRRARRDKVAAPPAAR